MTAPATQPSSDPVRDPRDAREALADLPPRIVFFDGVCSFCDGVVRWLRARDPEDRLSYASLQGETAARFRDAFPGEFPASIDSVVYAVRDGRGWRIEQRADAVIRLCEEIGGPWAHAAKLRALPAWLADVAYRAFAASRYRLFGRLDACEVPTPDERERLLP